MTDEEQIEEAYRQGRSDEKYSLAYAPPVFEKAPTPTDDEREARAIVRRAVGGVLFHVTNFPERAQSHLLGENMGPLNEKITDAVLDALVLSEVPEPSVEEVEALKAVRGWTQSSGPGVRVLRVLLAMAERAVYQKGYEDAK